MYELKKNLERYWRENLLGPGPRLTKKRIYRAAVWQRLRNTDIEKTRIHENTHTYMPKYRDAEHELVKSLCKIILKRTWDKNGFGKMSFIKNDQDWNQIASFCNNGDGFRFQRHHGIAVTVAITVLTAYRAGYAFADFLSNGMRRLFESVQWHWWMRRKCIQRTDCRIDPGSHSPHCAGIVQKPTVSI